MKKFLIYKLVLYQLDDVYLCTYLGYYQICKKNTKGDIIANSAFLGLTVSAF